MHQPVGADDSHVPHLKSTKVFWSCGRKRNISQFLRQQLAAAGEGGKEGTPGVPGPGPAAVTGPPPANPAGPVYTNVHTYVRR